MDLRMMATLASCSAARHADVLFVKDKQDNDLKTYVDKYKIPYTIFKDWGVIQDMVEKVRPAEKRLASATRAQC